MQGSNRAYALVTPARNEEDYIELTIKSVVAQSVTPVMWAIVSDRSTDRTDAIVAQYAKLHPFIQLVRNDKPSERNTAAKVRAIGLGLQALAETPHDFVGNLDADVSFATDYFEALLAHFQTDPKLGIAGGRIWQADSAKPSNETKASLESVAGAIQLFRKACFDQIGGYRSIPGGMEDGVAEITARFYGWKTRSFRELPVLHHRELGTVGRSLYRARFGNGLTEYVVGFSVIYHLTRAISRIFEKPYVIGTALVMSGYAYGFLSRTPKLVSPDIEAFIHREQMARLRSFLPGSKTVA